MRGCIRNDVFQYNLSSELGKVIKTEVKLIVSAPALMLGWVQVLSALGIVLAL